MTFAANPATTMHSSAPQSSSYWNEERYQQWLCERQLPVALQILGFVAFAIVGFGVWDAWLSSQAISHTWPLRAVALLFVLACALLLRFTGATAHWRLISVVSSCALFLLLLLILVQLPGGAVRGTGGLLLSAFLLRVHSPRLALCCALFNVLAVPIVFHAANVLLGAHIQLNDIVNSEIFLLIASVGNITLNFSDDQSDRQKFGLESQLQRMATTDGLTGASNRRFFAQKMDEELQRAHRYGYHLSLILLDIDHFKKVNDTRGHADGDEALKALAHIGIESGRASDTFARLGGEEFVMLLPHTDLDAAMAFAERLRVRIENQRIRGESGEFCVTASIGVAALKRVDNADAFLARADAALYLAKNQGRNRVLSQNDLISQKQSE